MSSCLALIGCEVRTPLECIPNALVLIEGRNVTYAGPCGTVSLSGRTKRLDLGGTILSPGFIDLQVNGQGVNAVLSAEPRVLHRLASSLAQHGTTAFLPTVTTAPHDVLMAAAHAIRVAWEAQNKEVYSNEAVILGLHLEGPFLAPGMHGAHPARYLRPIDLREIEAIAHAAGGFGPTGEPGLRLVTLSPELEGAAEVARWLDMRGVVPAMGHTAASPEQVDAFLAAGGRFAVHAYNRYANPNGEVLMHRAPGPMVAVTSDPRLMAGLIADGEHVHPRVLSSFVSARGWERTVLTSDLVADGGLWGGIGEISTTERATVQAGVLSGSRLSLGEMIPLAKKWSGLETGRALALATCNPSKVMGLEMQIGHIAPNMRADMCVLDRDTLKVRATLVGGQWVGTNPFATL